MSNEALRGCPTCGNRDLSNLGLRDYRWLSPHLPGRVSPTDIDAVIETHGHFLVLEMKPEGVALPMGQRIMLRRLIKGPKSVEVWVVRGEGPESIEVGIMDEHGDIVETHIVDQRRLAEGVKSWFLENNEGRPVT